MNLHGRINEVKINSARGVCEDFTKEEILNKRRN